MAGKKMVILGGTQVTSFTDTFDTTAPTTRSQIEETFRWGRKIKRRDNAYVNDIESVIGVTDLPDDFVAMRESMETMRVKVQEAERRHCVQHFSQILEGIAQSIQKVEESAAGPKRRNNQFVFHTLSILDERHSNALVGCVLYVLRKVLHSSRWFLLRLRHFVASVRRCQRRVRRWRTFLVHKQLYLVNLWCSWEVEQCPSSSKGSRADKRGNTGDVFNNWVSRDLKLETVHRLYREKRNMWSAEFRLWKERADAIKHEVEQQRRLLRKMVQCENMVRYMCGLPPAPLSNMQHADPGTTETIGPPPNLLWFEKVLTENSMEDLFNMAQVIDREISAKRVTGEMGIPFPVGVPERHLQSMAPSPTSRSILMDTIKAGNRNIINLISPSFSHPLVLQYRNDVQNRRVSERRTRRSPNLHIAAAQATFLGSKMDAVHQLAERQAVEREAVKKFHHDMETKGLINARMEARKASQHLGGIFALDHLPWNLDLHKKVESKEKRRWMASKDTSKQQKMVSYFTGACTFADCKCLMFKVVGSEAHKKAGQSICHTCQHWCRYHGLGEDQVQTWRATVSFGKPEKTVLPSYHRRERAVRVESPRASPVVSCLSAVPTNLTTNLTTESVVSQIPLQPILAGGPLSPASAVLRPGGPRPRQDLTVFQSSKYYKKYTATE